jgi:hypothetical protein
MDQLVYMLVMRLSTILDPGYSIIGAHPETIFLAVILRSKATKNLIVSMDVGILRSAQNDSGEFPAAY